jgi:hypothetical protein
MIEISEERYNSLTHKEKVLDKMIESGEGILVENFLEEMNGIIAEANITCEDSYNGLYIINADEMDIRLALNDYTNKLIELLITYRGLVL